MLRRRGFSVAAMVSRRRTPAVRHLRYRSEPRVIGDALDDRPVPAVWPRPTHFGSEKYLADFWIIEATDLDVALKRDART
jgi:hypothetical protein